MNITLDRAHRAEAGRLWKAPFMHQHRFDLHRTITDRIVAAIQANPGRWTMPWGVGPQTRRPINVASGHAYRGINIVALWAEAQHHGYGSPVWGTYRQWAARDCQVRRGATGAFVVFYKMITVLDADDRSDDTPLDTRLIARASAVFNADQVDGAAKPEMTPHAIAEPLAAAETFAARTGATIIHGGTQASYNPVRDHIRMPARAAFVGSATSTAAEAYYSTLLHELTHWTGARHRCDRVLAHRFGPSAYAMEELVAELGAAFLCADLGVANEPRTDHAQYLAQWLQILKTDTRAIFTAASKAAQAADFLHNKTAEDPYRVGPAGEIVPPLALDLAGRATL